MISARKLMIGILGIWAGAQAYAVSLTLETTSLFPVNSANYKNARFGIAKAATENELMLYTGQRFYFLKSEKRQGDSLDFQVGGWGGVNLGLSVTDNRVCCSLDTVDGFFGLISEFLLGTWGLGLEYNHLSAHNSDGRYINKPLQVVDEYNLSLKVSYAVTSTLNVQTWVHGFLDDQPRARYVVLEAGVMNLFWSALMVETFLRMAPREPDFESVRFKLSYWQEEGVRKAIPYFLVHVGDHYFGQRYGEQIIQWLLGLELILL